MGGSIGCGVADGGAAAGAAGVSAGSGGGGGGTLGLICCALWDRAPASKNIPKTMHAGRFMLRRLRFTLLSWVLPEGGSPHDPFYSRDGTRTKSRQPTRRAGRLSVQGRPGKYFVRGQVEFPAESREIVFPRIPVVGCQNRVPGAGNRGSRLHR